MAKRRLMINFLRRQLDLVVVSEFPKSGGSWMCQLLSDALNIPFPRNIAPKLERCVLHGHFFYNKRYGKIIGIVRDGRDVSVSAYYHFLFENDRNSPIGVREHRSKVPFEDYENIEKNLPAFIDYLFTGYTKKYFHHSWSEYARVFTSNPTRVCLIKYEDMLKDTAECLYKSLHFLSGGRVNTSHEHIKAVVEKYSFKNQVARNQGEENVSSFLRKGIAGDWKNKFTDEACQAFDKHGGQELVLLNYEKNRNWY